MKAPKQASRSRSSVPRDQLIQAPTWKVVTAFLAVYIIWGSTYLAIRFAIETLPPLAMAAVRFLVAGALLYAWARRSGVPAPTAREWRGAAVVGALLLLGGNGGVVLSQQWIPSGLAALLVATVPLWMVLVHWLWGGGARPGLLLSFGLVWGLAGVALLVSSREIGMGGPEDLLGGLLVLAGSFCWALGSVLQRRLHLPAAPRMSTALQMLAGGASLLVAALLVGEAGRFRPDAVSLRSVLAVLYLTVFGSLVAFSAYIWLLRVTTPARVATYAYVNPVVALLLGWVVVGEQLTGRTLLAGFVILTAVMLISVSGRPSEKPPPASPPEEGGGPCVEPQRAA